MEIFKFDYLVSLVLGCVFYCVSLNLGQIDFIPAMYKLLVVHVEGVHSSAGSVTTDNTGSDKPYKLMEFWI